LLSEYTHALDSVPLDLARNFADLRELDAVLSSSLSTITSKIYALIRIIFENNPSTPKEERLWLLNEIAEEAGRLKLGGEDKIRVACQAADNLKSHSNYIRSLLESLPGFDTSVLRRRTTYPHIATRNYMPAGGLETGRRRRGGYGSLLTGTMESPSKRKRVPKEDDADERVNGRSPRKEKAADGSSRNRNAARKRYVLAFTLLIGMETLTGHEKTRPCRFAC
jgi:inhibitor of growth protein 3